MVFVSKWYFYEFSIIFFEIKFYSISVIKAVITYNTNIKWTSFDIFKETFSQNEYLVFPVGLKLT